MTITNYTFFSPNGNDFPITANADGKLYMMLTGMNKGDFRLKHWVDPINSALNRIYVNTSLVVGGRYFELQSESVTMYSETTNYIHATIDLSNTSSPVTITAEKTNTSNSVDINNGTGILKVCFEIVVTTTSSITSSKVMEQNTNTDILKSNKLLRPSDTNGWLDLGNFTSIKREGGTVTVRVVNAKSTTAGNITLGTIPVEHRPVASVMSLIPAWSAGTTNDKHVQLNGSSAPASGGQTILSAVANQEYTFQYKYEI